ncbi:PAS domain S-box-containing protein [Rhizobium subbaraonis]|uniref:Sensor protein FixL n=1 Tax=Rhizobium subbaraonis TaxID=908946 RepID=A0A285V294_9HYPH|nr:PAS domain S-box protein [Rhizobium subbaraonis]SOC48067.1 PAS domain S-box-containing protein [Rhizobium subbaraonis]
MNHTPAVADARAQTSPSSDAGLRPASSRRASSYLNLFAAGLILPLLLFAVVLAWYYVTSERQGTIDRARAASREMATTVDQMLSRSLLVLQQLATSTAIRQGNIAGFREDLSHAAGLLGHDIVVIRPGQTRPVMSSAAPEASLLPELDRASQTDEARAATARSPVISNLIRREGSDVVALYVPVLRGTETVYVLSTDLPASQFLATLSQVELEPGWVAGLADGNGRLIARTQQHATFVGDPAPSGWHSETKDAEGVWIGKNIAGADVAAAYVRFADTDWTMAVTVPLSILNAPVWRTLSVILAIGGMLTACAIAFASWMGSRLSSALSTLQGAAAQLAGNAEVPPVRTPVEEINEVGAAISFAAGTALRREAHLISILETVPSAMVVIDSHGTIRSFSATAERLFGYEADEVAGRNVALLMPEPYHSAHDGYIGHYLRTGERRIMGRSRIVTGLKKDGTQFPLELHVGEAEVEGEKVFTGFMQDQTEKQRIEQELRQTQKIEAIGKLTGGVAHDFNNLLTVINGNLEMLDARLGGRHRQLIADAQEASNLAARLTASLLAFGRKMPLNPVHSDVGQIVAATAEMLGRTLGETIEIKTAVKAGCRTVVDAPQLQNALLNLGINARDAMPKGGRLTMEVSHAELDADYAATYPEVRPGRHVLIAVSDTGVGMSPETIERAFEPFYTTKPYGAGTGLGLSSVYGFVKQSGGHVAICSEEQRGTTVRIYLPAASDVMSGRQETARRVADPLPTGRGERILVVEDDDRVRHVAMTRLKSLGYSVLEAANGQTALELLDRERGVDLLFTDMVMPGMSGAELVLEVRRRWPLLPVLFTSGYAEPDALRNVGVGREEWLTKPYSTADLAIRLDMIFRG